MPTTLTKKKAKTLNKLIAALESIDKIFDTNLILSGEYSLSNIQKYYKDSSAGYTFLHSREGSIHMALNHDGKFNKKGYYEHAKIVADLIRKTNAHNILELASGKGLNLNYLANIFPTKSFWGIDITPQHVQKARQRNHKLSNINFVFGDFANSPFMNNQFDIIFAVEGFCYATNLKTAFMEVYRILKPDGLFVVFDGFRTSKITDLPSAAQKAVRLTEKSMAVPRGYYIQEWLNTATSIGFETLVVKDLTRAILPNVQRLYRFAHYFFKQPQLATILKKVLPPRLTQNAIAGLLLPITIELGIHGYFLVTLRKPNDSE